ncbi:hypothetical protein ACWELJ_22440 [Nocardia sp. NPDC004582]
MVDLGGALKGDPAKADTTPNFAYVTLHSGASIDADIANARAEAAGIEDEFGLPYLGYAAAPGLPRFGTDVFDKKN